MSWDSYAAEPTSWQAARWGSDASQRQRMLVAISLARPRTGERVLDYGCGTGRLSAFLDGREKPDPFSWRPPPVEYLGVDQSSKMLARAEREHPEHGFVKLKPQQIRYQPDVTFALGVWNLKDDLPHEKCSAQLHTLWTITKRVLVASFATTIDPRHHRWPAYYLAELADAWAERWTVERWKPNDIMLVLRRG